MLQIITKHGHQPFKKKKKKIIGSSTSDSFYAITRQQNFLKSRESLDCMAVFIEVPGPTFLY